MISLEKAVKDFQIALKIDNDNPIIYSNMGLVLRKIQKYDDAIHCYTREIQLSGANSKCLNNRAYCYAKLGKCKEAIKDYTKSL